MASSQQSVASNYIAASSYISFGFLRNDTFLNLFQKFNTFLRGVLPRGIKSLIYERTQAKSRAKRK